jgi:hypothetical protein
MLHVIGRKFHWWFWNFQKNWLFFCSGDTFVFSLFFKDISAHVLFYGVFQQQRSGFGEHLCQQARFMWPIVLVQSKCQQNQKRQRKFTPLFDVWLLLYFINKNNLFTKKKVL